MTTPPRNYRKSTPSPTSDGFKTPQNPRFSPGSNPKTLASRCASEPIKSKKKQPQQQQQAQVTHRTSPLTFAGAKCLDPPTASSLPRPPTTWTKQESTFSAKQVLSFEDLVQTQKNSQNPDLDPLSQQLKMLLKVQAWRMKKKTWIKTENSFSLDGCDYSRILGEFFRILAPNDTYDWNWKKKKILDAAPICVSKFIDKTTTPNWWICQKDLKT